VHPGELLRDVLEDREMTQAGLARMTGYTPKHINRLIRGHERITVESALRLEQVFEGITAEYWLILQQRYDLHEAREGRKLTTEGNQR
jgi:addiction module HigA family antidote